LIKTLKVILTIFLVTAMVFTSRYFIQKSYGDDIPEMLYIGIIGIIGVIICSGMLMYIKTKKHSKNQNNRF